MAKYFASEAALANAEDALRIHGAAGYSRDLPVERYYREAPLLCIGEGTNEIQRSVIARPRGGRSGAAPPCRAQYAGTVTATSMLA
jgi:alkylation response protein AidB-like acyl-CoA dehydrogenase